MAVMATFVSLSAQTYTVYSVIGGVKMEQGQRTVPLEARKQLKAADVLLIEAESALTLLDEKNSKMFSLSAEGRHTVRQLVHNASHRSKIVSKQYMSYLVKQLFSKGSTQMAHPNTYMQVTATSYRSTTNDSMLLSRLSQLLPLVEGRTSEELLCTPGLDVTGDMKVSFELVSCDTGLPITGHVKGNTGSYVRVHNETDDALYVNVLDIDQKGNKYLVLPVDSAATCAHLLVPSRSTVSFKAEPFIFADEPSQETFILLATEEPVDFSILMNPIGRSGRKTMKTGIYRSFYQVQ